MKTFEAHFAFETIVQIRGETEEEATENLERILTDGVRGGLSTILYGSVDYNEDDLGFKDKENAWFEVNIQWSGMYYPDAQSEREARAIAFEWLNERLTPFYQAVENVAGKNDDFVLVTLRNEKTTDVFNSVQI